MQLKCPKAELRGNWHKHPGGKQGSSCLLLRVRTQPSDPHVGRGSSSSQAACVNGILYTLSVPQLQVVSTVVVFSNTFGSLLCSPDQQWVFVSAQDSGVRPKVSVHGSLSPGFVRGGCRIWSPAAVGCMFWSCCLPRPSPAAGGSTSWSLGELCSGSPEEAQKSFVNRFGS